MRIHREGHRIILMTGLGLFILNFLLRYFAVVPELWLWLIGLASVISFIFVISFFRIPSRKMVLNSDQVIAPADGRIVAIEEVHEKEYFKDKRIQVSIFMSPANVHVNRSPISGEVKYTKYHPGNYLVAWHPKSSEKNERYTTVIEHEDLPLELMVRQIAGKVARKISNYLDEGDEVLQGGELGFIKFGSRVDIFLPLSADLKVSLKDKVKGGTTIIAELS